MSSRGWIPDSGFPSPDDFESSVEHAKAVEDHILSTFRKEKKGAEPSQTLQRKAKFYGIACSNILFEERHALSDIDLEWAIDVGWDEPSNHMFETFVPALRRWFIRHGWHRVDLNLLYSDDWGENDILVSPTLLTADDIIGRTEYSTVISSNQIKQQLLDQYPQLETRIVSPNLDIEEAPELYEISAAVTAVETQLSNAEWLSVEASIKPVRIWLNPKEFYKSIYSTIRGRDTISRVGLHEEILSFIESANLDIETGVKLSSNNLIEKFERELREKGWEELNLVDETIWYSNNEEYVRALSSKFEEYETVFENPLKYSDHPLAQAQHFLSRNYYPLIQHDFFEGNTLDERIDIISYHIDAVETLEAIRKAKREKLSGEIIDPSVEEEQ